MSCYFHGSLHVASKIRCNAANGSAGYYAISIARLREEERPVSATSNLAIWEFSPNTLRRGKVVAENGPFAGAGTDGQYRYRKIAEEIHSGACL